MSLIDKYEFFISDFSLHSIGIILFHQKRYKEFNEFIQDMILDAGVSVVRLSPDAMKDLITITRTFKLDFDDADQYKAAQQYDLDIVSFDADFDRTERGRRTPQEIVSTA